MRRLWNLLAGIALLALASCRPVVADASRTPTATPFLPVAATLTPYLPLHPTLTSAVTPAASPDYIFHGIDFTPGAEEITLRIWPASDALNRGRPIKVRFLPGSQCNFGDHQACVYHFRNANQQEVLWVSVHSGVTGEGQELRHALEGTGINSAGLSLEQVLINLAEMNNAVVTLRQGQKSVDDASAAAFARVPAVDVPDYLLTSFDQALEVAFAANPDIQPQLEASGTLLIIETCGWRMPGEQGWQFVSDTTASIYLGIIY